MTSPNTFLIANATLIEEELREHRRRLHEEAERHRRHQVHQIDKSGPAPQFRQQLGRLLIAAGERLSGDNRHTGTVLHHPPTAAA